MPRNLERHLSDLADSDPLVRRDAARALGELGDRAAVPALVDALRRRIPEPDDESHAEHASRAAAAVALGKIGDPAAAEPLLEAIADPFNLGTAASTALGRLDPPPVARIVEAAGDADSWRRARAAMALGEIGDHAALDTIVGLTADAEEHVRRAAAAALDKLRDPRAAGALKRLLENESETPFVRSYAAMALGGLKDASAVPALMAATGSPDALLRRAAARALCRIDAPATRTTLERLASSDPDKTVRDVVSRYLNPRPGQRQH